MVDFYDQIRQSIAEESSDNGKYKKLAEIAPTEKMKKILTDIAHEEERHREYLKEILGADIEHPIKSSAGTYRIPPQDSSSSKPDASSKIYAENPVEAD